MASYESPPALRPNDAASWSALELDFEGVLALHDDELDEALEELEEAHDVGAGGAGEANVKMRLIQNKALVRENTSLPFIHLQSSLPVPAVSHSRSLTRMFVPLTRPSHLLYYCCSKHPKARRYEQTSSSVDPSGQRKSAGSERRERAVVWQRPQRALEQHVGH